jgi:hypothetical protein
MSELGNVWDRQEGEPDLWFDRFERFRRAGASRTLLSVYNEERQEVWARQGKPFKRASSTPSTWSNASQKWNWRSRASAFDQWQRDRRRQEDERAFQQEQAEARRNRRLIIKALSSLLGKITVEASKEKALNIGDTDSSVHTLGIAGFYNLARAAAVVFKESRLEFGEATDNVHIEVDFKVLAVQYIKAGEIDYAELAEEYGADLADQLFIEAGVPIEES